jgi:hypothetical protein
MKLRLKGILLATILLVLGAASVSAQCRTYAQKKCVPELGDYRPNGSLYANYLENGQEIQLNLVLIGGQKYRLLHCHKEGLGQVWIQLFDHKGKVVFDNSEHNFATTWDFSVQTTQEFSVKTFISGVGEHDQAARSCGVLLLGNKFK